jgi:DNA polymerase III epsilon subunit-like protein
VSQVDAVTDQVAIAALWGGVRLVVIDTETTRSPGGGGLLRVVSIAAVTCRGGTVRGKWQTLVNPQVPIDRESRAIHGIADEHLVGEPIFADVAGLLMPLLSPRDGEKLVLCAHNVGFDVGVLRHELELVGLEMPNLPVLDMMGKLASFVGVQPASGKLTDLIAALGIVNNRPHDAMADAVACADAAVALLNRAAGQGHTDFDELLAEVAGSASTGSIRVSRFSTGGERARAKSLPAEHVHGHATVLSKRAGVKLVAAWREQVAECAHLRCRHLDARVSQAEAPYLKRMEALEAVLEQLCVDGDTAGAATVVGAMIPLLEAIDPYQTRAFFGSYICRWERYWAPRLTPLGRCEEPDFCPSCRRREACPLDVWPDVVGRLSLGDPGSSVKGYLRTSGRVAGAGTYSNWKRAGVDERVLGGALLACADYLRTTGNPSEAARVARLAWEKGCRHPGIADALAGLVAAPGRLADFEAAAAICDEALLYRAGSSSDGWLVLLSRRNQLAGRAQRLRLLPSGQYDENGNPIPLRRHHPETPRRTRAPRFIRQ